MEIIITPADLAVTNVGANSETPKSGKISHFFLLLIWNISVVYSTVRDGERLWKT